MPARRLVAPAAVVALLAASAAAPAATVHTIRTKDGQVTRIGPMRATGVNGGRVMDAIAAFGTPARLAPIGGSNSEACRAEWAALRLRMTFSNFGGQDPCGAETGRLQQATIRSRRFRTARGLGVGDRSSTIKDKHPNAVFRDNVWWITSIISPVGDARRIPTIEAIVQGGRVRILRLWIGAAGD